MASKLFFKDIVSLFKADYYLDIFTMKVLGPLSLFATLLYGVESVPSTDSLGCDLTLLVHNDILGQSVRGEPTLLKHTFYSRFHVCSIADQTAVQAQKVHKQI